MFNKKEVLPFLIVRFSDKIILQKTSVYLKTMIIMVCVVTKEIKLIGKFL